MSTATDDYAVTPGGPDSEGEEGPDAPTNGYQSGDSENEEADEGGWCAVVDRKSHRRYYFNKGTRETSWKPPPGYIEPSWREAIDALSKRFYYYNRVSGEITWEKPQGRFRPASRLQDKYEDARTKAKKLKRQTKAGKEVEEGFWKESYDKALNRNYYFHTRTKQTMWKKPECYVSLLGKVRYKKQRSRETGKFLPKTKSKRKQMKNSPLKRYNTTGRLDMLAQDMVRPGDESTFMAAIEEDEKDAMNAEEKKERIKPSSSADDYVTSQRPELHALPTRTSSNTSDTSSDSDDSDGEGQEGISDSESDDETTTTTTGGGSLRDDLDDLMDKKKPAAAAKDTKKKKKKNDNNKSVPEKTAVMIGKWRQVIDPGTKRYYWFHVETRQVRWLISDEIVADDDDGSDGSDASDGVAANQASEEDVSDSSDLEEPEEKTKKQRPSATKVKGSKFRTQPLSARRAVGVGSSKIRKPRRAPASQRTSSSDTTPRTGSSKSGKTTTMRTKTQSSVKGVRKGLVRSKSQHVRRQSFPTPISPMKKTKPAAKDTTDIDKKKKTSTTTTVKKKKKKKSASSRSSSGDNISASSNRIVAEEPPAFVDPRLQQRQRMEQRIEEERNFETRDLKKISVQDLLAKAKKK